jgi:hypothetical protein
MGDPAFSFLVRTHSRMLRRFFTRSMLTVASALLVSCGRDVAPPSNTPAWLADRSVETQRLLDRSSVRHDFKFTDALGASGISFVNRPVDDAAKYYKAVHYDHGTGLAVADVNGDGLDDLFFVTQLGTSELWQNKGAGVFTNVTQSAGLEMPDAIAVGASFADIDNDGDPDLFVTTVRHGNRLFENTGGCKFRDISAAAGVGFVGHSSGAVFFDYDGDGLLDLFVTNVGKYTTEVKGRGGYFVGFADAFLGHMHAERSDTSILYRNLGNNRFRDVTRETGLVDLGWSGDATIVDANNDGRSDVLALNMQGPSHLWLNEGGKRFRDATRTYMPQTSWGAMGVKVLDFNNDGRLDVFVTDMHSDMFDNVAPGAWGVEAHKTDPMQLPDFPFPSGKTQFVFGNTLFLRGEGAAPYAEVSDSLGVETYCPWGPSAGDLNADGYQDLFITAGMNFPYRYEINSLLLNDRGKRFLPSEFALGVEPRAELTQPWFSLDCDGADRALPACGDCAARGEAIGCKSGPNGSTMYSSKASRSSAIVDIDNDGDLDIVTNEFGAAPRLLLSNLAEREKIQWIKVRLTGTRSNRDGLGAVVTLTLPDGANQTQVNDGKSGYLSQSESPLYFGLGKQQRGASIEVRWPSGTRQVVSGPIASGQAIEVVELKSP